MTHYTSKATRRLSMSEKQRALERIKLAQDAAYRHKSRADVLFLSNCKARVLGGEVAVPDLIRLQEVFERYEA